MSSIGEQLRGERERQGLSISKIAEQLRINSQYLEAIESGETEKLPGGFFYRSFVRQYARFLGLDENRFEQELETLKPPAFAAAGGEQQEKFPVTVPPLAQERSRSDRSRFPSSLVLLILTLLAGSAVYSLWYKNRDRTPEPAPQQQQAPTPVPPPQPVAQPAPAPAPQTTEPPKQELRTLPPDVPGARFQIVLKATENSWVSLSSSGKFLYVGILKAGESRTLEAANAAKLVVGNAGGLDVQLNGKPLGPIGPRGQPRTWMLTPAGAEPVAPKKPAETAPPPAQPPIT